MNNARKTQHRNSSQMKRIILGLLLASYYGFAPASDDSSWIESLYMSFETAKSIQGINIDRSQIALQTHDSSFSVHDLELPDGVSIQALSISNGSIYFTVSSSFSTDEVIATPRDILRADSDDQISIYQKAAGFGIPSSASISSLSIFQGEVLFSLDSHAFIGTFSAKASDVFVAEESGVSLLYDAESLGLPSNARLTGLERTAEGSLLISTDISFHHAGTVVMPGVILEYFPSSGDLEIRVNVKNIFGAVCRSCDLSGLAAQTIPGVLFRSEFSDTALN